MRPAELLSTAAGLGILALVALDIFATVLHHWGRAGPIGRFVVHSAWRAALLSSRSLPPARRHHLLGVVGPALIPLLVVLWAGLIILGFALIYLPWIEESFRPDTGVPPPSGFADALHFSGVSFFTIGYGDIVPVTSWARALGIIEGGAGFALITLVISYFFSVYGAYTHKTVLAESVYYQAGHSADAARILTRHLEGGMPPTTLVLEVGRLRDGLVRLRAEYSDYPILHFFRDRLPQRSFLRLLFICQDLSLLLDVAVDSAERPDLARLGARSGLSDAAEAGQHSLVRALLQQVPEAVREGASFDARQEERWRRRLVGALQTLHASGIPVREEETTVQEYCARRKEWEPLLRACTEALGEEWEEVSGGC